MRKNAHGNAAGDKSQGEPANIQAIRSGEIARIFRDKYGITLPDDDAGRDDVRIMLDVLAWRPKARKLMENAIGLWAPWMPPDEAGPMIDFAIAHPRRDTADGLAHRLGLTLANRTRLTITTIGAIDCNKAERKKLRNDRKKAKAKMKRDKEKFAKQAAKAAKLASAEARREAFIDRCWDEVKKPAAERNPRLMRAWGVDHAMSQVPGEWFADRAIVELVRNHGAFGGLNQEALRKAVQRAVNDLVENGVIEIKPAAGSFEPRQSRRIFEFHDDELIDRNCEPSAAVH